MTCELNGDCKYQTWYGCENADCNVYKTLRLHLKEYMLKKGETDVVPTRIKLRRLDGMICQYKSSPLASLERWE